MEPDPRRNQRIAAGVVGIALFMGTIWFVATGGPFSPGPSPTPTGTPAATGTPVPTGTPALAGLTDPTASKRVGFIGLPPEGAAPSTPKQGALVLDYAGREFSHRYEVWVYADGRMIWQREGDILEGANEYSTGFLEQRLTPDGLELLKSRGSAEEALFGFPWLPPYPASWLPPRAWEDRNIRAYVPSRYAVCYQGLRRPIGATRILTWLPAPAAALLRAGASDVGSTQRRLGGFGGGCSDLTTEEARAVAEALEDAGLHQDVFQEPFGLSYYLEALGPVPHEAVIRFEPILPHGEMACSGCG